VGRKIPLPGAEPQIIKSIAQVQCYPKFNVTNEVKKFIIRKEVRKPCTWNGKRQEAEDNMDF
jgi:hypothetical protein